MFLLLRPVFLQIGAEPLNMISSCQTSSETAPLDMLHVKSRLFFSLQSKSKHEMCLVFVTNTPLFIQLLTVESIYWVRFQHNIIKFWSIQNVIMASHNHRPHHHQHHQYSRRRWFGSWIPIMMGAAGLPCLNLGNKEKWYVPGWQKLAAFRRGQKWPQKLLSGAHVLFSRQMRRFCV